MSDAIPFRIAGRTVRAMSIRPAELDDPVWLRRRYERDGDMAIALDLGVNRKTVRLARERLGIPSQPPGRRRGGRVSSVQIDERLRVSSVQLIAARIVEQSRPGRAAATKDLVVERIRALHEADAAGDHGAVDDAILEAAAALGLWFDHRQRLRRAA